MKKHGASRASGWAALLNGSKYRASNSLRKLNGREKSLRVEIVLARLVDDANQSMFRGINVWEKPIDLSALQGDLVTFIVEADDEMFGCWSHRL